MSKLKELLSDWRYMKLCVYIAFTATFLYILYYIINHIDEVMMNITTVVGDFFEAISPLIIGLILAYLLSPLVDVIDRKIMTKIFFKQPTNPVKLEKTLKRRHMFSIVITFLIVVAGICSIIYAFAVLIVGQLTFTSLQSMVDSIIDYFAKYEGIIREWAHFLPQTGLEYKLQDIINIIINWFSDHFSTVSIMNFVAEIGGNILDIVLGIIVSIYLIKDRDFFKHICRKLLHLTLPQKTNAKITETLCDINTVLSQFLRGQLLDALIIAVLSSIGLTLIKLDFAVFIGCFAGIANVIPYFGPVLGMIPAAIIGFLTGGTTQALFSVLILFIIQQIDSGIIYPRVVGSSIGLHPVFVLVSIGIGGYYLGIIGMVIAVPIAAIIKVFIMKKIESLESREVE